MRTLKLDSSFRPIQIIDAFDAFNMVWMNRAHLIESYDNITFRSTHDEWDVPCVIVIKRYVKMHKFTLVCNRKNVLWRDRFTCQYCASILPHDKLTLDHVTPRSRGGPKSWENIVTCCIKCNQKKGNKLPHEANMVPLRLPKEPPNQIFHTIEKKKIHNKWLPYLKGYPFIKV
jgi:hypothetical protein